jgi:HKD family nuclease
LLLDPNKDAFGNPKFGIPNRAVAEELHSAGVDIRWVHTHGEQCHTKMLLREDMSGEAVILLGSANLTRRNLDNFNLETNVLVRTQATAKVFKDAKFHFDLLWQNQPGRVFSVTYEHYRNPSVLKRWLSRFMEASGFSTF